MIIIMQISAMPLTGCWRIRVLHLWVLHDHHHTDMGHAIALVAVYWSGPCCFTGLALVATAMTAMRMRALPLVLDLPLVSYYHPGFALVIVAVTGLAFVVLTSLSSSPSASSSSSSSSSSLSSSSSWRLLSSSYDYGPCPCYHCRDGPRACCLHTNVFIGIA